jgi:phosphotriesterase-related protein
VGNSGIRPGAIKCATSSEPTPIEEKFLEAASIAHHRTGLPIITHTTGGLGGPQQQATFKKHGVAPHCCLIGHCCDNSDPAYHRRVVDGGTYIGFDRLGFEKPTPETSADNVVRLVRDGFRRQVMLSMDRLCVFQGAMSRRPPTDEPSELKELMDAGKWPPAHTYLFEGFIPLLRERGLSDAEIFPMLDENPIRFFAGERI